MSAVADAEVETFSSVYAAQHRRLLRIAYLLRGDLEAAEDDVADAFARTYQPWLDGRVDDIGAYLRTAVVNASRSAWRSRARRARVVLDRRLEPVESAELLADREVLRAALARLPKGQREAVVLRYVDDLSEASTAAVLGVSIGTVKSQVARGLAALRAALEQSEDEG
jgi:RNA polymerase sigma-70 factor (ECF subfamily)